MANGPNEAPAFSFRKTFVWTELFRCFQVALDPRKLLVAAVGILVMSLGWYVLSTLFNYDRPDENAPQYTDAKLIQKQVGDKKADGSDYTPEEYAVIGKQNFVNDLRDWKILHDLAGDGGQLRTLPWYEYRGPNPFLFLTTLVGGSSVEIHDTVTGFFSGTVPVLVEPLRKILLPVVKLLDPNATFLTRVYLLLALAWSIATWAFFGGIISRIAAVQFAGKERVTLQQAAQFVANRYISYLLSPLVPLIVIGVIVICMAIYGFVAMIPGVGDLVLYGLLMPLVFFGGIAIAVLMVGLVGYPLMFTTISTEGTDTFDAVSRSYNYVFQAPWNFLWYSLVAIFYGAIVTLFVVFMGSLTVYMGKWAVSQAPGNASFNRQPDFLFLYAPESFGWKQLMLKGSDIAQVETSHKDLDTGRVYVTYTDANPDAAKTYRENLWGVEKAAAGMVSFWMVLVFLLVIGFSYSYFWTASTMIYLLMRKKVDETDLDEVYVSEDVPPAPTPGSAPATSQAGGSVSLPTLPPAPASAPASPPVTPPTPAPAVETPPVTPPASPPTLAISPPPTPPVVPPAPSTPSSTTGSDEPAKPDVKSDDADTKS